MKTTRELLLSKFPLLPESSDKAGIDRIVEAMDEYAKNDARRRYDKAVLWWNENAINAIPNSPNVIYGSALHLIDTGFKIAAGLKEGVEA